ncbi:MAG TPA: hypothetical protein VIT23_10905 [Terrimicrobiaceae bacterium]
MGLRWSGIAAILLSLTVWGCATQPPSARVSEAQWQMAKERQQRIAREAGRIGYIGNAGPALGSSVPP